MFRLGCGATRRAVTSILTASLVFGVAACGDDDDEPMPSPATSEIPDDLLGSWRMELDPEDVPPDPAPELTDRAENWTLEISEDGGPDGGPGFALVNDELGTLESSSFEVIEQRLLIHEEECAVAPEPVESEYEWSRTGSGLEFSVIENGCGDDVVLTLLTSGPWDAQP